MDLQLEVRIQEAEAETDTHIKATQLIGHYTGFTVYLRQR